MKRWIAFAGLMTLMVSCNSTLPAVPSQEEELAAFDQWVPKDLQGDDRLEFIQALSKVAPDRRGNATVVTSDGRVLTNNPTVKASAVKNNLRVVDKIESNLYRYRETGEEFRTFEGDSVKPSTSLGSQAITCKDGAETGGFYRANSKPGAGSGGGSGLLNYWTASKASVNLPTVVKLKYDAVKKKFTENPYILLGGWPSGTDITGGVDAGLQGNPKVDASGNTYLEWQIFLKNRGVPAIPAANASLRFSSGSTVDLFFDVSPRVVNNALTGPMEAHLSASSPAGFVNVALPMTDWDRGGRGSIMKRLTGIAQPVTSLSGSILDTTTWTSMFIGGYRGTSVPTKFSFADWSGNANLYCFNPDASHVTFGDADLQDYFENITINLTK